jgi:hypothetical protein
MDAMVEEMTAPHAMIAAALCAKRVQFGGLERALSWRASPCGLRCHLLDHEVYRQPLHMCLLCGGEHLAMRWKDWCGGRGFPNNACDVHVAHDEIVDVFEQAIALK